MTSSFSNAARRAGHKPRPLTPARRATTSRSASITAPSSCAGTSSRANRVRARGLGAAQGERTVARGGDPWRAQLWRRAAIAWPTSTMAARSSSPSRLTSRRRSRRPTYSPIRAPRAGRAWRPCPRRRLNGSRLSGTISSNWANVDGGYLYRNNGGNSWVFHGQLTEPEIDLGGYSYGGVIRGNTLFALGLEFDYELPFLVIYELPIEWWTIRVYRPRADGFFDYYAKLSIDFSRARLVGEQRWPARRGHLARQRLRRQSSTDYSCSSCQTQSRSPVRSRTHSRAAISRAGHRPRASSPSRRMARRACCNSRASAVTRVHI